jgi:hypothetical protein
MANKGGVMVKLGKLKGFVPASQLDPSRFNAAESLMDQLVTLVGQSVSTKVRINTHARERGCRLFRSLGSATETTRHWAPRRAALFFRKPQKCLRREWRQRMAVGWCEGPVEWLWE